MPFWTCPGTSHCAASSLIPSLPSVEINPVRRSAFINPEDNEGSQAIPKLVLIGTQLQSVETFLLGCEVRLPLCLNHEQVRSSGSTPVQDDIRENVALRSRFSLPLYDFQSL